MATSHCLYHKHLHTAPRCNLPSRLTHSHQCTCTLPKSNAPSHTASQLLTFALTSSSHLTILSHYNLVSRGVLNRLSTLLMLRLTSTSPRMAFTESISLELPLFGLRVNTSRKKYVRPHGLRLTIAFFSHCAHHKHVKTFCSGSH